MRVIPAYHKIVSVYGTHAAARETHLLPSFEIPIARPARPAPLTRQINSRRLLRSEDFHRISILFPGSVGVGVLICNFIIILFDSESGGLFGVGRSGGCWGPQKRDTLCSITNLRATPSQVQILRPLVLATRWPAAQTP